MSKTDVSQDIDSKPEPVLFVPRDAEELGIPVPGDILKEKFMVPLNLSSEELAGRLDVSASLIESFIAGREPVTEYLAGRLGRFFGTSPTMWLNLQDRCDEALSRSEKDPFYSRENLARLRQTISDVHEGRNLSCHNLIED